MFRLVRQNLVETYLTRNTSLQTQHRNQVSIDSKGNQAVLTPRCGVKYRISLVVRQWTFYNVSD